MQHRYSSHLDLRYDAHINVEFVMSLSAAKYITKYTHKGPDRATIEIQRRNEVSEFRDCRYIAASEACWRIFENPIHHQQPAVMSLQVHLPGQHMVVYNSNESAAEVTRRAAQEKTMLTAFFRLNGIDPSATRFTYQEIPQHYVWDRSSKEWKTRQRGGTIGRILFVSPTAGERFYLRTLLITVRGPTSWQNLRSFNGVEHPTFHAACLARGLLENDDEWRQCLLEASLTHLGHSLRQLFSVLLRNCEPSQPDVLWYEFRASLCDDLAHKLRGRSSPNTVVSDEDVYDYGLFLIEEDLARHGLNLSAFPSMPRPLQNWVDRNRNDYISDQLNYSTEEQLRLFRHNVALLNPDQMDAFEAVHTSVCQEDGRTFFLHGAGGTGKTFVYRTICNRIRANGWIVLCVASSGIASLLLPGGHTAHSTFSIPVENLTDESCCQVDKNSRQADMMRLVRLIVWDEAVTQHR
jgi:hypothetical protein